jgi:hypothetical protein
VHLPAQHRVAPSQGQKHPLAAYCFTLSSRLWYALCALTLMAAVWQAQVPHPTISTMPMQSASTLHVCG